MNGWHGRNSRNSAQDATDGLYSGGEIMKNNKIQDNLLEKLAKLEHEQWIQWSRNIAQTETISPKRLKRWEKLWVHYSVLPEKQKETDREWARKVINTLEE
jgi:hypothetical protein